MSAQRLIRCLVRHGTAGSSVLPGLYAGAPAGLPRGRPGRLGGGNRMLRSLPGRLSRLSPKSARRLTEPHLLTASYCPVGKQIYLHIQGFYRSSLRSGDGRGGWSGSLCQRVGAGRVVPARKCSGPAAGGLAGTGDRRPAEPNSEMAISQTIMTARAKWPVPRWNVTWQRTGWKRDIQRRLRRGLNHYLSTTENTFSSISRPGSHSVRHENRIPAP